MVGHQSIDVHEYISTALISMRHMTSAEHSVKMTYLLMPPESRASEGTEEGEVSGIPQ